eukprot:jgi/Psemu1/8000/gm1.8000_g
MTSREIDEEKSDGSCNTGELIKKITIKQGEPFKEINTSLKDPNSLTNNNLALLTDGGQTGENGANVHYPSASISRDVHSETTGKCDDSESIIMTSKHERITGNWG